MKPCLQSKWPFFLFFKMLSHVRSVVSPVGKRSDKRLQAIVHKPISVIFDEKRTKKRATNSFRGCGKVQSKNHDGILQGLEIILK